MTGYYHWQQRDVIDILSEEKLLAILKKRRRVLDENYRKDQDKESVAENVKITLSELGVDYAKIIAKRSVFFSQTIVKRIIKKRTL